MLQRRLARVVLCIAALNSVSPVAGQQPHVLKLARPTEENASGPYFVFGTFSPDGKRLAAMCDQVTIWNVETKREETTLPVKGRASWESWYCLAFTPDASAVVFTSRSQKDNWWHTFAVVETPTGKLRRMIEDPDRNHPLEGGDQLAISPNGELLAVGADGRGTIRIWDLASGRKKIELAVGRWVRRFAFSPDGKSLLIDQNQDIDGISLWDVTTGQKGEASGRWWQDPDEPHTVKPSRAKPTSGARDWKLIHPAAAALSADHKRMAFVAEYGRQIVFCNVPATRLERQIPFDEFIRSVAIFPDGSTLVILCCQGKRKGIYFLDLSSLKWVRSLPIPTYERSDGTTLDYELRRIFLSPDGRHLASIAGHRTVLLWDLAPPEAAGAAAKRPLAEQPADSLMQEATYTVSGGAKVTVSFERPSSAVEVRKALEEALDQVAPKTPEKRP